MNRQWLFITVSLLFLAGILLPGSGLTYAYFSDTEAASNCRSTAWTSDNWTQTYTSDFNAGVKTNVDTSGDEVKLTYSVGSGVTIKSPSTSSGAWANATGAYADNGTYASVTSGTPSASENYSGYGFNLTGATITKVQVRLDAWSAGGTTATYTIRPIADNGTQGLTTFPSTPTTHYSKVNEITENISNYNYNLSTGGLTQVDRYTLNTPPADISGGIVDNVTIRARLQAGANGQGNVAMLGIRIGTTDYGMTPQSMTNTNLTYAQAFSIDPSDNLSWSWSDLNGLVAVCSLTNQNGANKESYVYQLWADISYRTASNEQIRIEVSQNGGASWSAPYTQNLTGSETTYWIDVTNYDAPWTPSELTDSNFKIRVTGYTIGDPGEVRLDWIPVEVTYTGLTGYLSPGSLASQVYNTAATNATWDGLYWSENVTAGTDITFEVRASNTSFPADNTTIPWISVGGTSGQPTNTLPAGQYKQWRATLTTTNPSVTPVLYEVRVWYDP